MSLNLNSPPKAILHWSPPNLIAYPLGDYVVTYNQEEYPTSNTSLEIDLMFDQLNVGFHVYVKSLDRVLKNGALAYCEIQSTLERRTCELRTYFIAVNNIHSCASLDLVIGVMCGTYCGFHVVMVKEVSDSSAVPTNARGVTFMCPSDLLPGSVQWDNPEIPITNKNVLSGIFVLLEEYRIHFICLHEINIKEVRGKIY